MLKVRTYDCFKKKKILNILCKGTYENKTSKNNYRVQEDLCNKIDFSLPSKFFRSIKVSVKILHWHYFLLFGADFESNEKTLKETLSYTNIYFEDIFSSNFYFSNTEILGKIF